ncbi:MAG TPA: CBS domain-containing protein [Gammaproteobacteria bacterium]
MKTVSDIMISDVTCVNESESVYQARMLMKAKGVRHLPVIDSDSGNYIGVLTQRSLLNHAFNMVEKFGLNGLQKREQRTPVGEIMSRDCESITPDMDLLKAAEYFTHKKSSCLPVVENQQLRGIITSVDFVKLAVHLLRQADL